MTRVIILAAGTGSRLEHLTQNTPKCLVELCGTPIIFHQLKNFYDASVTDITVIGGYKASKLECLGLPIIVNNEFRTTNMVESLFRAYDFFDGTQDLIVSYSDIITQSNIIHDLVKVSSPNITVVSDLNWKKLWKLRLGDKYLEDAESFVVDQNNNVVDLGRKVNNSNEVMGQYIGLLKIPKEIQPSILKSYRSLSKTDTFDGETLCEMYLTTFLRCLLSDGYKINNMEISSGWLEIDTVNDLKVYHSLAQSDNLNNYCILPIKVALHDLIRSYYDTVRLKDEITFIDQVLIDAIENDNSQIVYKKLIKLSRKIEINGRIYKEYDDDFKALTKYGECSGLALIALLSIFLLIAENKSNLYFVNTVLKALDYSKMKQYIFSSFWDLRLYALNLVEKL